MRSEKVLLGVNCTFHSGKFLEASEEIQANALFQKMVLFHHLVAFFFSFLFSLLLPSHPVSVPGSRPGPPYPWLSYLLRLLLDVTVSSPSWSLTTWVVPRRTGRVCCRPRRSRTCPAFLLWSRWGRGSRGGAHNRKVPSPSPQPAPGACERCCWPGSAG